MNNNWESAVVRIWKGNPASGGEFRGSGFLVTPKCIVTAMHVITHQNDRNTPVSTDEIYIQNLIWTGPRRPEKIELHPRRDIAVMTLEQDYHDGTCIALENGDPKPKKGEEVKVVGYTRRDEGPEIRILHVSNYDNAINSFLLDDGVPLGMSGGPVLRNEKLIGVIHAREKDLRSSYFIPFDAFKQFLEDHAGSFKQFLEDYAGSLDDLRKQLAQAGKKQLLSLIVGFLVGCLVAFGGMEWYGAVLNPEVDTLKGQLKKIKIQLVSAENDAGAAKTQLADETKKANEAEKSLAELRDSSSKQIADLQKERDAAIADSSDSRMKADAETKKANEAAAKIKELQQSNLKLAASLESAKTELAAETKKAYETRLAELQKSNSKLTAQNMTADASAYYYDWFYGHRPENTLNISEQKLTDAANNEIKNNEVKPPIESRAQETLGHLYYYGYKKEYGESYPDIKRARLWLEKAKQLGNDFAIVTLNLPEFESRPCIRKQNMTHLVVGGEENSEKTYKTDRYRLSNQTNCPWYVSLSGEARAISAKGSIGLKIYANDQLHCEEPMREQSGGQEQRIYLQTTSCPEYEIKPGQAAEFYLYAPNNMATGEWARLNISW